MNLDNAQCGQCVDPLCCGLEVTPISPCTTVVNKLEPRNEPQFICSPKVCDIFGGHDTNYFPESETCQSPSNKHKHVNLNTLGTPIGLVQSSFGIKSSEGKAELHVQRFATYIKAFAKIYLTPENEWNTATVDLLLKEGQQLYTESKQNTPEEMTENDAMIYSETEAKIKRSFDLDGYSFQVELNEKFKLNPIPFDNEELVPDASIELLKPSLKAFFRLAKYCLLKITNWYLLVWKARGVYFVFDFYGRRVNDFVSDRDKGVAMLICLKTLENVCHLVMNLSGLQKTDAFNLRELKVVKLTGPDGKTLSREYGKRVNEYEIINGDYAFLKATLHLTLNRADPLRNRSALPVGVAALLASKIDHPATWNQRVLDKLICFGVNICRCCWEQCLQSTNPIELDRFPDQLKIGQFHAGYVLKPRSYEGTWKCVPNYKNSEFALAIEKSFEISENHLLIQVDHQIYAVWKKNDFIYLFDPYRHRIATNVPGESTDEKSASLRMFRSLDVFLSAFTQLLLESNHTTNFYIHTMQVKKLDSITKHGEGVAAMTEAPVDQDADEVKSLNEIICFEEDETKCMAELGEISDYEEEDIISGVVEMDIKEPKSDTDEAEEALEEEEGGMEDLAEIESSSSGDGDAHKKRRKKKRSKSERDKKSTDKDKNEKSKRKKKGKGAKDKDADTDTDKDKSKKKGNKKSKKGKDKKSDSDDDKDREKKKRKSKKSDEEDIKKKKKSEDSDKDELKRISKKGEGKPTENKQSIQSENSLSNSNTQDPNSKFDQSENVIEGGTGGGNEGGTGDGTGGGTGTGIGKEGRTITGGRADNTNRKPLENEDNEDENDGECGKTPITCKPNHYPGYSCVAHDMAVVGSESGTYESICKLLRAGFKCADRILTMTPWGNYVVFRSYNMFEKLYFLFDGCTCNVNRFRHLDLNCGTAGLLCFQSLHDVISYIIDSQKIRTGLKRSRKNVVDEICRQYCT